MGGEGWGPHLRGHAEGGGGLGLMSRGRSDSRDRSTEAGPSARRRGRGTRRAPGRALKDSWWSTTNRTNPTGWGTESYTVRALGEEVPPPPPPRPPSCDSGEAPHHWRGPPPKGGLPTYLRTSNTSRPGRQLEKAPAASANLGRGALARGVWDHRGRSHPQDVMTHHQGNPTGRGHERLGPRPFSPASCWPRDSLRPSQGLSEIPRPTRGCEIPSCSVTGRPGEEGQQQQLNAFCRPVVGRGPWKVRLIV